MPNWSSSNFAVRGKADELKAFADIVNSLPFRKQAAENGFGPWWLGNLVDALGGDWKKIHCRGVFEPDPGAPACWSCAAPDPGASVAIGDDGLLRFSIVMAWRLDEGLLDFIKEKYPSFEFFYKSTDEFGNFHIRIDPENLVDAVAYELYVADNYEFFGDHNTKDYRREERGAFLRDLERLTGREFPDTLSDREVEDRFVDWQNDGGDDESCMYVEIWEDAS